FAVLRDGLAVVVVVITTARCTQDDEEHQNDTNNESHRQPPDDVLIVAARCSDDNRVCASLDGGVRDTTHCGARRGVVPCSTSPETAFAAEFVKKKTKRYHRMSIVEKAIRRHRERPQVLARPNPANAGHTGERHAVHDSDLQRREQRPPAWLPGVR